ncbi:hypothetical protein [Kitasatospora indigofera]|uniref:hypothetical protein n=1 Tax=Kitasatospora indigofera TaxID=67307 RepID=UPI00167D070F|nr:hypothetical protein [Kitasatospora indigofera]
MSGGSGSGKSHLVSWLATACSAPDGPGGGRRVAALSAAGLTGESASWLLARRLGLASTTPTDLVADLRSDDRPCLLLLWDLNLACEPDRITDLLARLLALSHVRIVAELADPTTGPAALADVPAPALLDLDQPQWTDLAAFTRWYRTLAPHSALDADTVFPNPYLARLAARTPAQADAGGGVAATWWAALPEDLRPALRALAAAPRPLTRTQWSALAAPADVDRAARLLPAHSATEDTWWLPKSPLREAVTAAGAPQFDHAAAMRALAAAVPRTPAGTPDLPAADPELLGLLLHHAVQADSAATLLTDPHFLVHADPAAVTAAFAAHPDSRHAAAWRAAGPALIDTPDATVRAAVLRTRLLSHDPDAAAAADGPGTWRAQWASWLAPTAPSLVAAALTRGAHAGYLLLADASGLRAAHLETGEFTDVPANPVPPGTRSIAALADGSVVALDAQGQPLLLAGSVPPALPHPSAVTGSTLTVLGSDGVAGDGAGRVHWPSDPTAQQLHTGAVTALDALPLSATGRPLVVSGGVDGCVRLWGPGSVPLADPVDRRGCQVVAAGVGESPEGVLVVTGWADGLVRAHRLDRPGDVVDVRLGSPVRSVHVDDSGRIVVALADGVVSLWIDPHASDTRDRSSVPGFYFAPEPPPVEPPLTTVAAGPRLPDAVRAEARRRPGRWLCHFDPAAGPDGARSPQAIVGWWQIDHQGVPARFIANPAHDPQGDESDLASPDPAEAALQQLMAGNGSPRSLLTALLDSDLHVCTGAGPGQLFTSPGANGRDAVDACTGPALVPRHWAGTTVMTGRALAAAAAGHDLRLTAGTASVTFPVDDLAGAMTTPGH